MYRLFVSLKTFFFESVFGRSGQQADSATCNLEVNLAKNFVFSMDKENQLDVTFCILYFSSNSCSTCFGQPCAHHQELTTA